MSRVSQKYNVVKGNTGIKVLFVLFFSMLVCQTLQAQRAKKRNYFPAWTFQQDSTNIHGLSVGLWTMNDKPRNTTTNGVKFELIGIGIILPLMPSSPVSQTDSQFYARKQEPFSERINGFNISTTGSGCQCLINGISLGAVAQINTRVNGISVSGMINMNEVHNGIMAAMITESYRMNGLQVAWFNKAHYARGIQVGLTNKSDNIRGIQIGIFNKSANMKGLQIGLWNVNQKRKFPLLALTL